LRTELGLEVAKAVPAERLLLETDAPWCSIKPTHPSHALINTQFPAVKKEKWMPGNMVKDRNEPCCLLQVAEVVAAVRNVTLEHLAEQCWMNSERLFFYDK
jgi:TatD DNase family protein